MIYDEVREAFFDTKVCSIIFYSVPPDTFPMVALLMKHNLEDFYCDDIDVDSARIIGAGKHPLLIVHYDMPIEQDMSVDTSIRFVLNDPNETVDHQAWLYMVPGDILEQAMQEFQMLIRERDHITFSKPDEPKRSKFYSLKKGEKLASIFYAPSPLPNGYNAGSF
jgi:hypothetical protein